MLCSHAVIENRYGRIASVHIILEYAEKYTSIFDAFYDTLNKTVWQFSLLIH